MKKSLYVALTVAAALSLAGCWKSESKDAAVDGKAEPTNQVELTTEGAKPAAAVEPSPAAAPAAKLPAAK